MGMTRCGAGLALCMLTGCASHTVHARAIALGNADRLTPDQARMTGFLEQLEVDGVSDERSMLPSAISAGAIMDEVAPAKVDAAQTCFLVVQRTPAAIDAPLSTWTFVVNREDALVRGETVHEVTDYNYQGVREVVSAAIAIPGIAVGSLAVTQPEAQVFRVVERRAEVCGPGPAQAGVLELAMQLGEASRDPAMTPATAGWQEHYRWEVSR